MDAIQNATTLLPVNGAGTGLSLDEVMDAIDRAHEESFDADVKLRDIARSQVAQANEKASAAQEDSR